MFACGKTALILMLAALAPSLNAADEARPQAVRVDHYGDPLPPGAIARLGTLRMRHQGSVASMDFSPDGKIVASCGEPKILVRLWDTTTGKEIRRITGAFRDELTVVKFSPTGRILAGGSRKPEPNIFLWDVPTGKLLHRLEGTHGFLWDVEFLDEKTLVSVDDEGQVRWWNVATGKKVPEWDAMQVVAKPNDPGIWKFEDIRPAILARDGRTLAAIIKWEAKANKGGSRKSQNRLTVWDLDQRKKRWNLAEEKGDSFGFFNLSADGKILAITGSTGVSIRDGITGRELRHIKNPKEGSLIQWESLALSRDGKMMATLTPWMAGVHVWDVASGKSLHQLRHNIVHGPSAALRKMIFAPDGKALALSCEDTLALWDVTSPIERLRWEGHHETVVFLSFSPDGKELYSGGDIFPSYSFYPLTAVSWDTTTWRETARSDYSGYQEFSGSPLFVSPDHRLGVVHNDAGDFFVTNRVSGKKLRQLAIRSKEAASSDSGFFSPSGKTVVQPIPNPGAKRTEDDLALLDVATGRRCGSLPAKARYFFLEFAPDDRVMAWIDQQAVIHVVAVDGGKELRRLGMARRNWAPWDTVLNLTFSADGRHLAFWEREVKEVVIWDWRTGKEYRRLPSEFASQICLAYSPDGRCLAVGRLADVNEVELWELASGRVRRRVPGHLGDVCSLAFSPDGRLLASGSEDTTVLIWDLYGFSSRDKSAREATPERLQTLWAELAHTDAQRAGAAMTALLQTPQQIPSLFAHKLQPVSVIAPERVARDIADLDGNEFAVRQKAARELEQLAELAEPALRKALADKPSLEARRRIETLLDKLDHLPPERLREVRAVEVLELLGTPEARELLQRLAGGAPEARLTREARSSLERLHCRPPVR